MHSKNDQATFLSDEDLSLLRQSMLSRENRLVMHIDETMKKSSKFSKYERSFLLYYSFDDSKHLFKVYKLKPSQFKSSDLLKMFANDPFFGLDDNKYPVQYKAPFVPCKAKCKEQIKAYYSGRMHLFYTKNKKEVDAKFLFYVNSPPDLCISFSVMILHHAGIVSLFDKSSDNNFEEFLKFASVGASFSFSNPQNHGADLTHTFMIDSLEKNALDFAYSKGIEENGLFCIKNIDGIDKNFVESFKNFVGALSSVNSSLLNQDEPSIKAYRDAFNAFSKNAKPYSDYSKEPEKHFLYSVINAATNLDKCIEKAIKSNPKTYVCGASHYCICEGVKSQDTKRTNFIIDASRSSFI